MPVRGVHIPRGRAVIDTERNSVLDCGQLKIRSGNDWLVDRL